MTSDAPRDTDCPRTDKFQQGRPFARAGDAMDWPTFARQLERDLADTKAALRLATADIDAVDKLTEELAAANARAEQNEKDAERYRWLRANDNAYLLAEDVIDDAIAGGSREMGS